MQDQTIHCLKMVCSQAARWVPRKNIEDNSFSRLKEQFNETYGGSTNSGKPLILEGGLKWQPFGFTMRDAEF